MVFNGTLVFALFIVLVIWNVVLSLFLFRTKRHYDSLTENANGKQLGEVLQSILQSHKSLLVSKKTIEQQLEQIQAKLNFFIQRVGVVRFNPFSDIGGSQSFVIALLDAKGNGIVMTSLYARSGNRWYLKQIRNNKGIDIELSKEEIAAIDAAKPYV